MIDKKEKPMYSFMRIKNHISGNFYPLFCGMQNCTPSYSFGPAVRDCYILHFCTEGKGTFFANEKSYSVKAGEGFLICPQELTFYQADRQNPWSYIWVAVGGDAAEKYLSVCGLGKENPVYKCEKIDELAALVSDMIGHNDSTYSSELYNQGLLYQFFSYISKYNAPRETVLETPDNVYISKSIEYIKINYQNPVTVQDIADYVCLNRSYLTTIFKKNVGVSPQQFLMKYRITKAAEMLTDTDYSLENIACSCGYGNSLSFSKAFKKVTSLSPSRFRQTKKIPPHVVRKEDPHADNSY